jgi:hypothetical protein
MTKIQELEIAMDGMLRTIGEQVKDIAFLAERCKRAGCWSSAEDGRDTGSSSNSIVSIAYGLMPLEEQRMPADLGDWAACCRMLEKLPEHRHTKDVQEAMHRAAQAVYQKRIEESGV